MKEKNNITEIGNSPEPKKVLAIHDMSCFGRCALTVIIPTLSALGMQVIPLPTALLSTHTGGFTDFHFLDLTDSMEAIAGHWKKIGISFDAIYTGFLGSERQCGIINEIIDCFGRDAVVTVDPVMGDEGRLYQTVTDSLGRKIGGLVKSADIITPNVTEACFLLGEEYSEPTKERASEMLRRLAGMGAKKVVLTGILLDESKITTASFDSESGEMYFYDNPRLKKQYPGTGDIFTSVLLGEIINGSKLSEASAFASSFIFDIISETAKYKDGETIDDNREGVFLENHLGTLSKRIKKL